MSRDVSDRADDRAPADEPRLDEAEPQTQTVSERTAAIAGTDADTDDEDAVAAGRAELLEAENRRLRERYARLKRTEYRRAALALAAVGAVSVAAGALFPAVRSVLLVLGAIGLFGAILTRYLTPERFVSADVGERVYAALADNEAAVAAELGLQEERVYVPVDHPGTPARLFVPQRREYTVPTDTALEATFVVPDDAAARGLALAPTGGALYREFTRTVAGDPADEPRRLVDQLAESVVESFELADAADPDVDPGDGRATVRVTAGAFGDGERFDDPIASLLAVGLAVGLDTPVRTESSLVEDGYTVTCRWDADAVSAEEETEAGGERDGDGGTGGEEEISATE